MPMTNLKHVQMKLNSFNHIEQLMKYKEQLIKFCYFNGSRLGSTLKPVAIVLIEQCENIETLEFLYKFFDKYIYCIFNQNRTVFNRLRNYFMTQVVSCLLSCSVNHYKDIDQSAFFTNYNYWFDRANEENDLQCLKIKLYLQEYLDNCIV